MAEGIDEALRADDKGRVLFLLAQHGIRRPAPGSSSKGFCFNEIAKVGGARTFPPPPHHSTAVSCGVFRSAHLFPPTIASRKHPCACARA